MHMHSGGVLFCSFPAGVFPLEAFIHSFISFQRASAREGRELEGHDEHSDAYLQFFSIG